MTYPNRSEINRLLANPDYFAEQMSIAELDHVIFGFMTVRHYKES